MINWLINLFKPKQLSEFDLVSKQLDKKLTKLTDTRESIKELEELAKYLESLAYTKSEAKKVLHYWRLIDTRSLYLLYDEMLAPIDKRNQHA